MGGNITPVITDNNNNSNNNNKTFGGSLRSDVVYEPISVKHRMMTEIIGNYVFDDNVTSLAIIHSALQDYEKDRSLRTLSHKALNKSRYNSVCCIMLV